MFSLQYCADRQTLISSSPSIQSMLSIPKLIISMAIFVFLCIVAKSATATIADFCWKNSYTRDVGKPLSECPKDNEKDAGLCYDKCKKGYKGVGPLCWVNSYGRGVGFAWQPKDGFGDEGMKKRCQNKHGRGNCEKCLAMYYPKCKKGFKAFGCNICKPKDKKLSYDRGVGKPMDCPKNREKDGALCYTKCKERFNGVGPVCWARIPKGWVDCGMGAAESQNKCIAKVTGQVTSVGIMAANVATLGSSAAGTKAATGAQQAQKLNRLRKQFARLKAAYKANAKSINRLKTSGKAGGKSVTAASIGLDLKKTDSEEPTPEDMARIALEIASLLDPSGAAAVGASYTYPTCDKVK